MDSLSSSKNEKWVGHSEGYPQDYELFCSLDSNGTWEAASEQELSERKIVKLKKKMKKIMYVCEFCSKEADMACSACRRTYYSDVECQKSHWKTHKHLCKLRRNAK